MKVPFKWLKDYIEIPVSAEEFADAMIMTGNGVEGIEERGAEIRDVLVGRIVKLEKHPDADRLQICSIDIGKEELLQIVTGADNVFEGALVPVAMVGCHLPNGMHIKKGKLRGVPSLGMLCSGEELCLKEADYPGAGVYGILILQDGQPGQDVREVLMMDDKVIEFEVGANRPDCLSVIGIAREGAAALRESISLPEPKFGESEGDISEYVKVTVENEELCPRYMARAVKNVKIGPSPKWMQERLSAAGVRPISNIVDITNFVMLETGQPMHAFDAADIRGKEIIVRRAKEGEKIVTLDGKERELSASMLLICDGQGPIGIAGVMGGENSEIRENTTTVVFESAKFMYGNIRQTSRGLGLATEASMRYSKGVDAANCEYALHRACQLVEELGAGEIVGGEVDILSEDLSEKVIETTAESVNALLGAEISAEEMRQCLERAFIKTELSQGKLTCHIPHFRGDMYGKADVAEEVARIYGYDNIPESTGAGQMMQGLPSSLEPEQDALRTYLAAEGYFESITYSFLGEQDFDKLKLPAEHALRKAVRIKNPLGDDKALMRTTLAPDMLAVMSANLKRKNKQVKLYEMNKVYLPENLPLTDTLPDERRMLALCMSADAGDFYAMKRVVKNLFDILRVPGFDVAAGGESFLHPGRKAEIFAGEQKVGQMGEIAPEVQKNFEQPMRVYYAEIDLKSLFALMQGEIKFAPLPKYPALERDIAVILAEEAEAGSVAKCIRKNGGKHLESVELFDVYRGGQLEEGQKSLAYSLAFRSPDTTLTDEAIAKNMEKILKALSEEFGATLRE